MVTMGEKILDSSENIFMNFPPYVFDLDHVAKIRSGLSITVLGKKKSTKLPLKKTKAFNYHFNTFNRKYPPW